MTFLNPILLYVGLGCIAVPIIVHLLTRRRRKPVVWAAMRFLIEAYKKHRRRLTLEQLLLLAARCLLVALVGVALGKPVLGAAGLLGSPGPRTLYLLVDNSLTASVIGPDGTSALDRHKAAGARLLGRLDQSRGDRAGLTALGGPAEAVVIPPSNDLSGVGKALEALTATDSRVDLAGALSRLRADLEGSDKSGQGGAARTTLALLSDWRAGSAEVDRPLPSVFGGAAGERPLVLATPPTEGAPDNIAVVRAEPLRALLLSGEGPDTPPTTTSAAPGEPTQVRVTLRRFGPAVGTAAVTQVSARIDRTDPGAVTGPTARVAVRWAPGQEEATAPVVVPLPEGTRTGSLALVVEIDRDPIAGDNVYRRPVETRQAVQVGVLAPPGAGAPGTIDRFLPADWVRLSLQPAAGEAHATSAVKVVDIDPRTVGQGGVLSGLDGVLIPSPEMLDGPGWSRVGDFCRAGGLVVVFPPPEITVHLWADGFVSALGLDWTIAREARGYTPATELAEPAPTGGTDLLALLSGEMPELVKPVRVSRVLPVETGGRGADVLLRLKDSTALLIAGTPGVAGQTKGTPERTSPSRGMVVLLACAPDLRWSDLPTKPLMLPLVQEVVRQGVGAARGVWTSLAGSVPTLPVGTVDLRPVRGQAGDGQDEALGLSASAAAPALRRAGLWRATDARGASLGLVAANADTAASRVAPHAAGELTPWLGSIAGEDRVLWAGGLAGTAAGAGAGTPAFPGEDQRPPISPALLAAAVAVALLELALARWFSHAPIDLAVQTPVAVRRGA